MAKATKELSLKIKQLGEQISLKDQLIGMLENQIQNKNIELENRLETISKLIHKNEQLTSQIRVHKLRFEKFKAEQVAIYQKDLSERASEVEVLKEMVRGNQTSLKSKEKEITRQKQKILMIEG